MMNIRALLYFGAHRLIGSTLGQCYAEFARQDAAGTPTEAVTAALIRMLDHCRKQVPYYTQVMAGIGDGYRTDPIGYLQHMPILTKDIIRTQFAHLTSSDLAQRRWVYNASGGSTGIPTKLIQDRDFSDRQMAVQLLSFTWAGRAFGESGVHLWGSERDILHGSESITLRLLNWISNNVYLNAYRMTPEHMRGFLALLNERRPKLIIAYAQSIYELAQFAEREQIAVAKQSAIVTSSEMLHPFMRAKVEQIFGCMIYDRYGCREVGDIASECQAHAGMHVFPWTNYVEIVDDQGMPVPAGVEGNILVTCLTNAAMPMIRYDIGDRGVLSSSSTCSCGRSGQILARVLGRDTDQIRRRDGTLIDEGYFSGFLSYKDWVRKYQIIQKDYDRIVYRIVKAEADYAPHELDEIVDGIRTLMGAECRVEFEFLDDIPASSSGKYRYTISEVPQHSEPATRH